MNFFEDRKLKKIAKAENIKAPDNYLKSINETLNNLPDYEEQSNKRWSQKLSFAVAMTIMAFLLLPNISPKISYAMQELPIIGNIVKIITIRNYFDKDGNSELDIEIPNIKNEDNSYSESNKNINENVDKLTKRVMDEFYSEKNPENHLSIEISTDIIENNENWFTLKLTISKVMASSDIQYKYYHIDKKTDKIIKLADLFVNEEYKNVMSEEIKNQMISRMKENENETYWLNEESQEKSFRKIDDDQNFYFSKDGNIVIVFDKYEVGPGSVGAPEFEIDKKIYEKYLK